MKPKPLVALNHFTVPVGILHVSLPSTSTNARGVAFAASTATTLGIWERRVGSVCRRQGLVRQSKAKFASRRAAPTYNAPRRILVAGGRQSHRRADLPGLELVVADPQRFGLGLLSRGCLHNQFKNLAAALLDRLLAVDDRAAIDVHVVGHPAIESCVGGELERRRRLAAEHRAAAGGEAQH